MRYQIVKKCWKIDLDKIDEGFMYSGVSVHADSRNEAKTKLLHEIRYDEWKIRFTREEVNYINIPVIRSKAGDIVLFEGNEIKKWEVNHVLSERKRFVELDKILENPGVQFCYIMKRGSYYAPNSNGYTDYKFKAGVYTKEEAVQDAKSCNELRIIPINIEEHNSILNKMIKDIESRIITTKKYHET